ncbi:prepilin peptidase [Candidatus Woesebacteria bacterium]|nr:prepilin peptidase [Candidatus Woesebacteria bacterium]
MSETTVIYIFLAFTGLFFGSFLNVLADRLSFGKTILGRSKCDACNHVLTWYDLVPIISYTLLKGKCRYCKAPFSVQYPLSEMFTAAIFVLTYYLSIHSYHLVSLHVLHIFMAAIFVVMLLSDLRYQIIPDEMQITLFLVAIARLYFLLHPTLVFTEAQPYILGAFVVMLPLLLVFLFTKGKGMGFGDVKYAVSMGLLLGMWNGLIGLYLAFVLGGFVGAVILLLRKGGMKTKIAFGPFLFVATYLMLFFEADIILLLSRIYRF